MGSDVHLGEARGVPDCDQTKLLIQLVVPVTLQTPSPCFPSAPLVMGMLTNKRSVRPPDGQKSREIAPSVATSESRVLP